LEEANRDKFVYGLASEHINKELLKEKTLALTKACETAISMEAVARDSSLMGASNKEDGVHQLRDKMKWKGKTPTKPDKPCYRCGKGHEP